MEFKDRIKEIRAQKGLSAQELADQLNKSVSAIRMWESGKSKPDADTLIDVAKHLNCSTDYLLGLSNFKDQDIVQETNIKIEKFTKLLNEVTIAEYRDYIIDWLILVLELDKECNSGSDLMKVDFLKVYAKLSYNYCLFITRPPSFSLQAELGTNPYLYEIKRLLKINDEVVRLQKKLIGQIGFIVGLKANSNGLADIETMNLIRDVLLKDHKYIDDPDGYRRNILLEDD